MLTAFVFDTLVLLLLSSLASARCPFRNVDIGSSHDRALLQGEGGGADDAAYDYTDVRQDIAAALVTPVDFWPPDFGPTAPSNEMINERGHYGGLFIRLAWHCNGSYRLSDGRGGCDGGRIRHLPEFGWADNNNLVYALRILEPIKEKYGDRISWADLIALSGNVAIKEMGGPEIGFCAGRRDDDNGDSSMPLGPSEVQQKLGPCDEDGECDSPLGPSTMGLIYVNPGGPKGVPDSIASAHEIRSVFSRMNMNDRETVALIGGGHAFGKKHGACPDGPGAPPTESFGMQPFKEVNNGTCGTGALQGVGMNTYTAGFEGRWTLTPTTWTNDFFRHLLDREYQLAYSGGGQPQWVPIGNETHPAPAISMLTSDLALRDDASYAALVAEFARDEDALAEAFSSAWYKLTTSDMGPATRCAGPDVPPALAFQDPLPPTAPEQLEVDYDAVAQTIEALLFPSNVDASEFDDVGGQPYAGALFATLAYHCAGTFRATDYKGGCNGGRIRFPPQSDWRENKGLEGALRLLEQVKQAHVDASFADLIVLAGNVALNSDDDIDLDFCPGRTDAADGVTTTPLARRAYQTPPEIAVADQAGIRGLTTEETVALAGLPKSPLHASAIGFGNSHSSADPRAISNFIFQKLVAYKDALQPVPQEDGGTDVLWSEYVVQTTEGPLYVTAAEYALTQEPFWEATQRFAQDEGAFKGTLAEAWTKLMIADRFDGPTGNVCL